MKSINQLSQFLIFTKKILILYLIISNSMINAGITIFPDHYEHDDEIVTTSQVDGITYERFYYSIGYFSDSNIDYISPKYGITYHPVKCENNGGSPIIYNDNDRNSFFLDIEGKPIRIIDSTRSGKNKLEETKLYQNTMIGNDIKCPSPFKLFHNKYFTITYKLPVICNSGSTKVEIRLLNDNTNLGTICSYLFSPNEYKILEIEITPKYNVIDGNEVETEYYC